MSKANSAQRGLRFLLAGLLAGLLAAVVNIIVYLIMISAGGDDWAPVVAFSILIASLLPNLLAAALYFLLTRATRRWAWPLLAAGVVVFVLVSVLPHLGIGPAPSPALAALPEGFDLVTVPLHVVFGLTAITVMPWLVARDNRGIAPT